MPIGRSTEGLPIGVQIVARPFADNMTIAVAGLIEGLRSGFVPPSGWSELVSQQLETKGVKRAGPDLGAGCTRRGLAC
jgi:hypothetical protein